MKLLPSFAAAQAPTSILRSSRRSPKPSRRRASFRNPPARENVRTWRNSRASGSSPRESRGKAAIYGALCWGASSIVLGKHGGGGHKEQEATKGILGWPGGRWIVGAIALAIAGAALWNLYRAISGKYKDSLKTGQMSSAELKWTTRIAFVGLTSRAVVFGLISWFFFKAAADYDAKKARGLDGALRELANAPYGTALLSIVTAGLFAYGLFCVIQARYREV